MINPVPGSYYIYAPTKGVSIVFAFLFAVSGGLHIWQNNIKYRSWRIGILLPWAALVFVVGFCLREYGAYHYHGLNIFIASQVMLFVAPPVYNGANYFIVGRVLYYLPYLSIIHPGRVWVTFITLDTIDGILAGNGASYLANANNTPSQRRFGLTLVKASLILLLALFLCFVVLVVHFHIRAKRAGVFNYNVKVIIHVLYASSVLILIRNTFRTAAAFYSWNSTANGKEWPFWVLEAFPMLVNTYLLNFYPPAKYLPKNHKTYLAVDGKTEVEGPGLVDKRHFLLTIFDPFDLHGLITGKDNKNKFWEKDGIGGPKEEGDPSTVNVSRVEEGPVKH